MTMMLPGVTYSFQFSIFIRVLHQLFLSAVPRAYPFLHLAAFTTVVKHSWVVSVFQRQACHSNNDLQRTAACHQ